MAKKVKFADRHIHIPGSRIVRIAIGVTLVIFGILGFLPVLGFWMIPLGLLVLSIDIPIVRRWRRQLTVWWHRKKEERSARKSAAADAHGLQRRRPGKAARRKESMETR